MYWNCKINSQIENGYGEMASNIYPFNSYCLCNSILEQYKLNHFYEKKIWNCKITFLTESGNCKVSNFVCAIVLGSVINVFTRKQHQTFMQVHFIQLFNMPIVELFPLLNMENSLFFSLYVTHLNVIALTCLKLTFNKMLI